MKLRKEVVCLDGFSMSVQASAAHYCRPRKDEAVQYSTVEIGYPSHTEDLLLPYAENPEEPTNTVYGYVPYQVVLAVIEKHNGAEGFANPLEWSK